MRRAMIWLMMLWASAAVAQVPPPIGSDVVTSLQVGVFCAPKQVSSIPAPGTSDGFISVTEGEIRIYNDSQQVPAALGMAFGVRSITSRTIANVRMVVTRPGQDKPDVWTDTFTEGEVATDFFSFDRDDERRTGRWSFEAWDGDTRLYRAEFDVVPESDLPDLVAACQATS